VKTHGDGGVDRHDNQVHLIAPIPSFVHCSHMPRIALIDDIVLMVEYKGAHIAAADDVKEEQFGGATIPPLVRLLPILPSS
jgi:hypothetical protein